jgi:hypothetical protein
MKFIIEKFHENKEKYIFSTNLRFLVQISVLVQVNIYQDSITISLHLNKDSTTKFTSLVKFQTTNQTSSQTQ